MGIMGPKYRSRTRESSGAAENGSLTISATVVQLTPPGRGAVATCLVSGTGAVELLAPLLRLYQGRALEALPPARIALGQWLGTHPEEVVVTRRGADEVSIHCHGGHVPVAAILTDLAVAGVQIVPWQQWLADSSGPAALRGPIAAEAVIALAQARTERCAAILLDQFHGALSNELQDLLRVLRLGETSEAAARLAALRMLAPLGLHLDTPWQVVICGAPNVGKSSLINALVGYGRAIVSSQPGTTRDVVSAATAVDGWPVELSDTAGIRAAADPLEAAGIAAAGQRLAAADLRLLVFDRSAAFDANEQALAASWPDAMIVHSKCDLDAHRDPRPAGIAVSALRGDGVESLLAAVSSRLVPSAPAAGSPVPFRPRHVAAIFAAAEALTTDNVEGAVDCLEALLTSGRKGG